MHESLLEAPQVPLRPDAKRPPGYRGKRALDLALASVALVLLSPLLAGLALVIAVCMGRPVLFRQLRPGLHGHPFTIFKFRTMRNPRQGEKTGLSDQVRITSLGQFLRATSLDELPELINVLRGEMSLVGPRPLLMQYLGRYTPDEFRRHDVLPGITGWAQIQGRNAISWEEKFRHDVWYVDHCSLGLDLKILVLTFVKVIRREGVNSDSEITMPEFLGTHKQ